MKAPRPLRHHVNGALLVDMGFSPWTQSGRKPPRRTATPECKAGIASLKAVLFARNLLLGLCLVGALSRGMTAQPPISSPQTNSAWIDGWRKANPTWRGVHLSAHSDAQAAQLLEALPRLASLGVNVLILEVDYSFEFRAHPEVRTGGFIRHARAHELAAAAHAQGVRLIPQLNCLGHQSWGKNTGQLLISHPEFDETPRQFPENKDIYCRSWCPQNPDVNKVVFTLVDDLAEGFDADALHVGMDEVFLIASEHCTRCRGGDPAKLFAKAVNDLHRHIVEELKLEMLMWGDRLLDSKALGFSEWEASQNGTQGAVDLAPKDIIVCDWHYEKRDSYSSIPFLLEKGFRVWPSGWQPLEATRAFSNFARKQGNPRLVGYLCTTWGKVKTADAAEWPPIAEVLADWRAGAKSKTQNPKSETNSKSE